MSGIQLTGLASGFDWASFIDQIMELERSSVTRLQTEQATNTRQLNSLSTLSEKMVAYRDAVTALKDPDVYSARTTSFASTSTNWSARADNGAATGTYKFTVSALAEAASLSGATDRGQGVSATSDVSGVLIADLPTRITATAGNFTINGAQVSVALTDSLQDIFDKISTATGGDVTASYDETTDKVTLSSASEIVMGASNDSSNLLWALGLYNNGTGTVTSDFQLGTLDQYANLVDARLNTAITAVDGSGNGSFDLNGVTIDYNVNDDSLSDIIAKINASTAGVRATYDAVTDSVTLINTNTGDSSIAISEASGGLMEALGLTTGTGATLNRGKNAVFTLNDGSSFVSASNTFDESVHGIEGLNVTATSTGSETITVGNDSEGVREVIDTFIAKFNDVQDYIEEQTKINTQDTEVTAGTLAGNREVDAWSRSLRQTAFAALADGVSEISRLESLGIDFISGSSKLEVKDEGKLTSAIETSLDEVERFFTTTGTGFGDKMDDLMDTLIGLTNTGGYLELETDALNSANSDLDRQIENLERQLESRRSALETAFLAMEQAQQKLTNMQDQLSKAFPDNSSSSSK